MSVDTVFGVIARQVTNCRHRIMVVRLSRKEQVRVRFPVAALSLMFRHGGIKLLDWRLRGSQESVWCRYMTKPMQVANIRV